MAWKVLSNLKHNGILYEADQIVHDLEADVARELEKSGIVQNLGTEAKADAGQVESQLEADGRTAEAQANQDAELARGQVESQLEINAKQDVMDAQTTAATPGRPVAPAQPIPATPTAEQIANDPDLQ